MASPRVKLAEPPLLVARIIDDSWSWARPTERDFKDMIAHLDKARQEPNGFEVALMHCRLKRFGRPQPTRGGCDFLGAVA